MVVGKCYLKMFGGIIYKASYVLSITSLTFSQLISIIKLQMKINKERRQFIKKPSK